MATHRPGIAERLWDAARHEFSQRGYHGARVQGIARRAGCNVALLYRHWASKKALYLDILRNIWLAQARDFVALLERSEGAPGVVSAYLEALLRDPLGSQIVVRETLDGGPFLAQLVEAEPSLVAPVQQAAERLVSGNGSAALRPGLDPMLVVLTVAGIAALASSAREMTRLFGVREVETQQWRDHLFDLLVNGIAAAPR